MLVIAVLPCCARNALCKDLSPSESERRLRFYRLDAALCTHTLQEELLHSVPCKEGDWRILVVDDVTVKVFSSSCKISDVTEENVSRAYPGMHSRR